MLTGVDYCSVLIAFLIREIKHHVLSVDLLILVNVRYDYQNKIYTLVTSFTTCSLYICYYTCLHCMYHIQMKEISFESSVVNFVVCLIKLF